jgi:hypothetical protein
MAPATPAPAAVSPNAPQSGDIGSPPMFEKLSAQERRAILAEIKKLDCAPIFQAMLDAGRIDHDFMKQGDISAVLAQAIRVRTPPPEFFKQLTTFIADNSNSISERGLVIGMLGKASTKESANLLVYEVTTLENKELKDTAVGAISNLDERSSDANITPALDRLWRKSYDPKLLTSLGEAMARIGKPSSIELLVSAALARDGKDDVRKRLAQGWLTTVISKDAVPPLAALLAKNRPTSPEAVLAFTTLAQIVDMKDRTSIETMMKWLQNADSSAAPLALNWIAHARNGPEIKAAKAALDPAVPFRSEANREALRAGLDKYNSGHIRYIRDPSSQKK